ncbi:hypothetical protein [Tengunoibacter tsumagoiensis]|uniref:Uncharacterized protein n=1 Tax=Tengunoibacter tsumagoiensis TaxID=2014871 RepID=A0A402A8R1_9CHLR|nr:hypothetical protein [Tengunoibacter tsumagoiensis]GCE15564.1 hypothetical protein KTT_54230 [Tengunoibacter tsumagoiensis]
MSLSDASDWIFECCLPRRERDGTWLLSHLQRLWSYGLSFHDVKDAQTAPLSWEEQLLTSGTVTLLLGEDFHGTFRVAAEQLMLAQRGALLVDNGVSLLYFQINRRNPHLDWVRLTVDGLNVAAARDDEEAVSYMEVYQAFVYWSKLLCETFEPLFGFGYRAGSLADELAWEKCVYEGRSEDFRQTHLPAIDSWFSHPLCGTLHQSLYMQSCSWNSSRISSGRLNV